MSYKVSPMKIELPNEAKKEIAKIALEIIRRDTDNGLNAKGETTKHDLRDSGKLMSDVTITDKGDIVFNVPYAKYVNAKIPFDGIAPQSMPEYEKRIEPIVNQQIKLNTNP